MNEKYGLRLAILSLDDFYLTHADQLTLQHERHPNNPLLQGRGLPGTHDMHMAKQCLRQLLRGEGSDTRVLLPVYDKSACGGQGDRVQDRSKWQSIQLPVDIIVIEGWMIGFQPAHPHQLQLPEHMAVINNYLASEYQQGWHCEMDVMICIRPNRLPDVYRWRQEQEDELRRRLNDRTAGLSEDELKRFIDRFMPCYHAYLGRLYTCRADDTSVATADDKTMIRWWPLLRNRFIITVDSNRLVIDSTELKTNMINS
jgi:D-glycerate 3-kinase